MAAQKAKQLRGEPLVDNVLDAALEELSARGYEGFSIEDVANRAGVNKTTIYRRWPTRAALARGALDRTAQAFAFTPDTGAVRSDLVAFLGAFRDFMLSVRGQTLLRMLLADHDEVAELARQLREDNQCIPRALVGRAVARGELPPETDATLIFETLIAALQHQVLFVRQTCDHRWIGKVVDLVLTGAQNCGRNAKRSAKRPARTRSTTHASGERTFAGGRRRA